MFCCLTHGLRSGLHSFAASRLESGEVWFIDSQGLQGLAWESFCGYSGGGSQRIELPRYRKL